MKVSTLSTLYNTVLKNLIYCFVRWSGKQNRLLTGTQYFRQLLHHLAWLESVKRPGRQERLNARCCGDQESRIDNRYSIFWSVAKSTSARECQATRATGGGSRRLLALGAQFLLLPHSLQRSDPTDSQFRRPLYSSEPCWESASLSIVVMCFDYNRLTPPAGSAAF